LQLLLQGIYLFGDFLEFLLGHAAGLGHLVRGAIRFSKLAADFHRNLRQFIFLGHCSPSDEASAIVYRTPLQRQSYMTG
jgi:hypothetical protein